MRLPPRDDPLQETTTPFVASNSAQVQQNNTDEEVDETFFDGIFGLFQEVTSYENSDPSTGFTTYTLSNLRKPGARSCGFDNLPTMASLCSACLPSFQIPSLISEGSTPSFISVLPPLPSSSHSYSIPSSRVFQRDRPSLTALIQLTVHVVKRRLNDGSFAPSTEIDANGTALSIIRWSSQEELNFDSDQRLAFQIITAAFVLTYYQDPTDVPTYPATLPSNNQASTINIRQLYNKEKKQLFKLSRLSRTQPCLRMFLDGPAGSGKSHVVKALLHYAEAYTRNLQVTFDMRTIVVTALSGVAATSIGGEPSIQLLL